jgi:hypothetical protein
MHLPCWGLSPCIYRFRSSARPSTRALHQHTYTQINVSLDLFHYLLEVAELEGEGVASDHSDEALGSDHDVIGMHIAHFLISALVEHARFDQMVENEPNFLLKVGTLIFAARGYFVLEEIFPLFENNLRYFDSTLKVPPEPHSSVLL